jgi:hypothetical protein
LISAFMSPIDPLFCLEDLLLPNPPAVDDCL